MTPWLKLQFPELRSRTVEGGGKNNSTNIHVFKHSRCGHRRTHTRSSLLVAWFFKVFIIGWKTLRASSGLVNCSGYQVNCLLSRPIGQGSISSGTMLRMTSSLPRLTTVRSVSSCFMAALTSLAEVIRSPLMLMMTSLSCRPALSPSKKSGI